MRKSIVLGVVTCISTVGCATGPATKSGFLGDYSRVVRVGKSDSLIAQPPAPGFDVSGYNAVKIDDPVIMIEELGEEDRRQLSAVFREALVERVGGALPLVERTGPGVLHVRSAITGARKANIALNVATSLLLTPVSRGGVAAEAEVLDGGTGARIAALSWSRRGAKITQVGLSYSRLGEAREGLRSFAARLAELFRSPGQAARSSGDQR